MLITKVRQHPAVGRSIGSTALLCTYSVVIILGVGGPIASAQEATTQQSETLPADDLVTVNVPEQVDLQVLVDYVGRALNIRFFYGEDIKGRRVELRPSPLEIPKSRLLHLLTSLLRVHDLVLVEEAPGLFRIIQAEQTQRSVTEILPADAAVDADSLRMVTQVLRVPSGKVEGLPEKLARYLSSAKGGMIPIPERGLLIVTDYAARIALIKELITLMDSSGAEISVATLDVADGHGAVLAEQVQAVLNETHRARQLPTPPPTIRANVLPDKLLLVGTASEVAEAKALLERLRPETVSWETRLYRPNYLDLQRLRGLIASSVGPESVPRRFWSRSAAAAPQSRWHAPARLRRTLHLNHLRHQQGRCEMSTLLERSAGLTVGTIEQVSPQELSVQLDTEAPHATALNAGAPIAFPRINSYLIVPGRAGAVVGQVTWIGIQSSQWPKRKGLKDNDLVDLPFQLRRLKLTPIGMLRVRIDSTTREERLELERGVSLFPSVGDPVLLPTARQLQAIVEIDTTEAPVEIGRSALADDRPIRVHPDRIFGRHLAVLGNTGSGKSCSVAGLIRWTLQAAQYDRANRGTGNEAAVGMVRRRGCRFVILDPNGEYKEAFKDSRAKIVVLSPPPASTGNAPLVVPAWMWNAQEWSSILQAAPGVQQPLLFEALRKLRAGDLAGASQKQILGKALIQYGERFDAILSNVAEAFTGFSKRNESGACLVGLKGLATSIKQVAGTAEALLKAAADVLLAKVSPIEARVNAKYSVDVPTIEELQVIHSAITTVLGHCPPSGARVAPSADHPSPFDVKKLPAMLQLCALASGDNRASQIIAYLIGRLEALLHDSRLTGIIDPAHQVKLHEWLDTFLGGTNDEDDRIVIVDLALVRSDVTHLIIAVIARILFEATQRYHKRNREAYPTVLVLEEAHTFIQEGRDDPGESPSPVQMCRRIFEKVAREGRKFGMGMVLSSQRPSEISPTVLSQCNTFLLHRLVNDRDQQLVRKLVPDTLGALLGELPVLPSRFAILLGHASPIPQMVVIRELPEAHRPKSSDPPLWDVWRGVLGRAVDWKVLAEEWADPSIAQPA